MVTALVNSQPLSVRLTVSASKFHRQRLGTTADLMSDSFFTLFPKLRPPLQNSHLESDTYYQKMAISTSYRERVRTSSWHLAKYTSSPPRLGWLKLGRCSKLFLGVYNFIIDEPKSQCPCRVWGSKTLDHYQFHCEYTADIRQLLFSRLRCTPENFFKSMDKFLTSKNRRTIWHFIFNLHERLQDIWPNYALFINPSPPT